MVKLNNNMENLEWTTNSENMNHYYKTLKPLKKSSNTKLCSKKT